MCGVKGYLRGVVFGLFLVSRDATVRASTPFSEAASHDFAVEGM
ncbi:MAG: hypothetical protein ACI906_005166 [Candidatus Latescibacterota bacterium]|jgi:hypothetical protein